MKRRPRVREAGIQLGGLPPGPRNTITDVAGVQVGHTTLVQNSDVRTGVTAICPHPGNTYAERVIATVNTINGFGKPIGFEQVRELGLLETPVLLTNTLSVGLAADALVRWVLERNPTARSVNPVVGECNDGYLNDIRGLHIRTEHIHQALECASAGSVEEGNVGAGTGMSCFGFKGGVGTASRRVFEGGGDYTVGLLVVANFGQREELRVASVPVGRSLAGWQEDEAQAGSVMVVLATDAPLTARQLGRVARRAGLGLARTGSLAGHSSGDFVVAFSTAQHAPRSERGPTRRLTCLNEDHPSITLLFQAAVEATEEAVLNALFAAHTMHGCGSHVRHALPIQPVVAWVRQAQEAGEVGKLSDTP
jgi:D-aminopeptidase